MSRGPASLPTHPDQRDRSLFGNIAIEIGLLLLSALLFSLAFPSFLSKWGWYPFAFIAFVPLFMVVRRSGWVRIFIYGIIFGYASYALFNFWLAKFHPLSIIIVPTIYATYFLILMPLLKVADSLFPRYGYLVQVVLWVAYEYLRTKGFLGYSYGIIGYSQYLFTPFIQISEVTGVWGVSLLVIFPSAFIGNALKNGWVNLRIFYREHSLEVLIYIGLFVAALVYGSFAQVDYSDSRQWRVALIQHNVDPWKHDYDDALDILIRLSEQATEHDPDIVIWSETAFVPAIDYHTRFRQNQSAYKLVKRLKAFLADQDVPYVIGNDDGRLERLGGTKRVDYNAALLFKDGEIVERYWKVHLVPFTESFPFKEQLPGIYTWLKNADTHFWEKGEEYTVFEADNVSFSTPICFEDTFGYLSRKFVRNGAEVIVNLTNDSWSHEEAAMMQHMAMSVFRAVENRRTVIRSTNGGITCTIDPNGNILDIMAPFVEGYLISDVPIYKERNTGYTTYGDWLGVTAVTFASGLLAFGIVARILRRNRR
jgi:apolipoprotein N-acyltransferase